MCIYMCIYVYIILDIFFCMFMFLSSDDIRMVNIISIKLMSLRMVADKMLAFYGKIALEDMKMFITYSQYCLLNIGLICDVLEMVVMVL